jgi:hypothetical protein
MLSFPRATDPQSATLPAVLAIHDGISAAHCLSSSPVSLVPVRLIYIVELLDAIPIMNNMHNPDILGTLIVVILKAKNLPDKHTFSKQ